MYGAYMAYVCRLLYAAIINHVRAYIPFNILQLTLYTVYMFYITLLKAVISVLVSLHSIVHVSLYRTVRSAYNSVHSSLHVSVIIVIISYMYRIITCDLAYIVAYI